GNLADLETAGIDQLQVPRHDPTIAAERFDDRDMAAGGRAARPAELVLGTVDIAAGVALRCDDLQTGCVPKALAGSRRDDGCYRVVAAPGGLPDVAVRGTELADPVFLEVIDPGAPPAVRLLPGIDGWQPRWKVLRGLRRGGTLRGGQVRPVPGDAEEDPAAIRRPVEVFHPAVDRWGGTAFAAADIEQIELEVTGLAAVGDEGDLFPVGRELGRAVGVWAERQHPGVAAGELGEAYPGRRLVRRVDQRAREDRLGTVRRDLSRVGDEPAAGPAERTVEVLGFPIEVCIADVSLQGLPLMSSSRIK